MSLKIDVPEDRHYIDIYHVPEDRHYIDIYHVPEDTTQILHTIYIYHVPEDRHDRCLSIFRAEDRAEDTHLSCP